MANPTEKQTIILSTICLDYILLNFECIHSRASMPDSVDQCTTINAFCNNIRRNRKKKTDFTFKQIINWPFYLFDSYFLGFSFIYFYVCALAQASFGCFYIEILAIGLNLGSIRSYLTN